MLNSLFQKLFIIFLVCHVLAFKSLNDFLVKLERLELDFPIEWKCHRKRSCELLLFKLNTVASAMVDEFLVDSLRFETNLFSDTELDGFLSGLFLRVEVNKFFYSIWLDIKSRISI